MSDLQGFEVHIPKAMQTIHQDLTCNILTLQSMFCVPLFLTDNRHGYWFPWQLPAGIVAKDYKLDLLVVTVTMSKTFMSEGVLKVYVARS